MNFSNVLRTRRVGTLAIVLVAACRDPVLPRQAITPQDSAAARAHAHQLLGALVTASDTGQCHLTGVPPTGPCSVTVSASPADFFSIDQQTNITSTFSAPVYRLIVQMGGDFLCSGAYGSVTAYNRHGVQVEQRGFTLQDPSDCGSDNVTCCAIDTIEYPGGISFVVIDPPQPETWQVEGGEGVANSQYEYYFYPRRPATVDSCLTGDELLDQQAMRDFLKAAWDSSHTNDIPANRRETPGYLFEDSTGGLIYRLYQHPETDTPCGSSVPALSALPDIPLANGHTHPFAPRDTIFPPLCGFNTPQFYDTVTYGGASNFDIDGLKDDGLPFYIVDKHNIYVYPATGLTLLNAHSKVTTYPRVDPVTGCTRL